MFTEYLNNVRNKKPLVHNITNYVTVNDCANVLLACGAAPIMADDIAEVEEITSICNGLNINIGTLNARTVESMIKAGKKANQLGNPVLLDPVGAGASTLRTETALKLLEEVKFSAIRGNISEIKTLALGTATTQGVDAAVGDKIDFDDFDNSVAFIKSLAKRTGAVIVVTGAVDLIVSEDKVICIHNGHPAMSSVTGTGCQLSAIITAFLAANPEQPFNAAATAVMSYGLAGEIAHQRMTDLDGNSSYRNYIIDAVYNLDETTFEKGIKYENR